MTWAIEIRRAEQTDAALMALVLRRSIRQLCSADHADRPELLRAWLANKTTRELRRWINNPDVVLLVALCGGRLAGVAALTFAGQVMLNYVDPDFRNCGVSKAMMLAAEQHARALGLTRVTLESTLTAERFYLGIGYSPEGPRGTAMGLVHQPMVKLL